MEVILGQFLAILTAACFAMASSVWSYSGKIIGSNRVTHVRLWLALPMIMLVHLVFLGTLFPLRLEAGAYVYFALSGVCGFALADLFIFHALVVLGARETLVILTLAPIFSTLVSWFSLSEKIAPLQIFGILIIIGGVMWVVYEEGKKKKTDTKHHNIGLVFAFIGAFAQAMANVLSKHGFAYDVHPVSAGVLRVSFGLLALIVFTLFRKNFKTDFSPMNHPRLLLLLISAAFIGPVLGVVISLYALTMAPVGIVTALMQMSPILLLPVDHFVFKKKITLKIVTGTCIAIAGAALLFLH